MAVAVVSAGSCSSDSTPSLEISTCHRCGPKKQTTTTATRSYHYTSLEWLKPSVLLTTPNAGGAVEQQELPSTAAGNEKWCSRFQRLAVSLKIRYALFFFFAFSRVAPEAYGRSQARHLIGAVAASDSHTHSNTGSEPHLQPTPQLTATPGP